MIPEHIVFVRLKSYLKIFLEKTNNYIVFLINKDYYTFNQLSPVEYTGQFLSEGKIHLSKWHPPVCDVENFLERRMLS